MVARDLLNIVVGPRGVACRGFAAFGQKYAEAYGFHICWRGPQDNQQPPDDMMVWDTHDGAQKFADMNGGVVTTVTAHFPGLIQSDAIVNGGNVP